METHHPTHHTLHHPSVSWWTGVKWDGDECGGLDYGEECVAGRVWWVGWEISVVSKIEVIAWTTITRHSRERGGALRDADVEPSGKTDIFSASAVPSSQGLQIRVRNVLCVLRHGTFSISCRLPSTRIVDPSFQVS